MSTVPLVDVTAATGSPKTKFEILEIPENATSERKLRLHRLNGLGSLFYFIKIILGRKRLTRSFHLPICEALERLWLKDLFELPRKHFKTTIASEGRPLWRALPFTNQDEDDLFSLGYAQEFVDFQRAIHNPNVKMLLVSANITNAALIGSRIKKHVESNAVYRVLFPETLPTTAETWSNFSLHMRRTKGSEPHGEGTFDFLGADSALQSRHYHEINQDDLVGPKAIETASVMRKIIEAHQLLPGAFDSEDGTHENPELVTGNRWGYHDLNSHIREHEPWFAVHSHGALGGCCSEHPADTPIFPEEFSLAKLQRIRMGQTAYQFSCQFLNNPCAPEDADFQVNWLRYYALSTADKERKIQHEVYGGNAISDIPVGRLSLAIISDPNHSGNSGVGRCRHSIVVVGLSSDGNYYLLEAWAKACAYDEYYAKIFELAQKYGLHKLGLETIAAQKYIGHHIEWLSKHTGYRLSIVPLKGEVSGPDGTITRKKEERIRTALIPLFEWGNFWVPRGEHGGPKFQDFHGEYTTFPKGKFVDIMDALAYAPQILKHGSVMDYKSRSEWLYHNRKGADAINRPYSAMVQ